MSSSETLPIDTHTQTAAFIEWLRDFAEKNNGTLPNFSNAEAGKVMSLDENYARHRGKIQSRIDYACYLCDLPPLGLAADEPYERAWRSDDTGWNFPKSHMASAVRQRIWSRDDFDRLQSTLNKLRPGATKLWKDEIAKSNDKIKLWAYSFVDEIQSSISEVRNPKWSRDELILALRLYLRHRASLPGKQSPPVVELSRLLNRMATVGFKRSSYRNTAGVYMKLMNFRSLDLRYTDQGKRGLTRGSKDDQVVWNRFEDCIEELNIAADAIEAAVSADPSETGIADADESDIEECEEGRVLTRLHRFRERNRKIIDTFKKATRKLNNGVLLCAGCDLEFAEKYGEIAERLLDVHHTKPVHTMKPGESTKLSDLVLLCVSCHRAVHSQTKWLTIEELRVRLEENRQRHIRNDLA